MSAMPVRHTHLPELQSLRGIAALIVVLHHTSSVFALSPALRYWSEVLFNAHAAVILFFVLSGYVLARALSGVEINRGQIVKFYVARFFRIYPALWLACILACLCALFVHSRFSVAGASTWYVVNTPNPSAAQTVKAFCGLASPLLIPLWSVQVELLGSLAMPLIAWLGRKGLGVWVAAVVILIGLVAGGSVGLALLFVGCFAVGAIACQYQNRCETYLKSSLVLSLVMITLLFVRRLSLGWRFDVSYNASVPLLVESLAAAALVIGLAGRTLRPLRSKLAIQLGDISYSVYLLHFTIMTCLATVISRLATSVETKTCLLIATTIALSIPLAFLSFKKIELRGVSEGKKAFRWLEPRLLDKTS